MLLKRKRIPFPIPGDARELTEEEMILVNGGSERRENSNEGVAGANVGDTIQRNDGTVVTLSQADIDYAKKQIGGSGDSDSPVSMKNASSLDGNTVANQNVSPSFGVPSCTSGSAKTSIQTSDSMLPNSVSVTNQTQGNNRLSRRDSSISMDMVERKRLLDMKEAQPVFDEMHKIDLGAGDMTVTERIEFEKKKMLSGKMDETTGKKFEGVGAGYEIDHVEKVIRASMSDKKSFAEASDKFLAYDMEGMEYRFEACQEDGGMNTFSKYSDLLCSAGMNGDNSFKTWMRKKSGDDLTDGEAKVQKIISSGEMFLGFCGIFFSGGKTVQSGAYLMADGAIVYSAGMDKKKSTPLFHLANDFANPAIAIPDTEIYYVSPLP